MTTLPAETDRFRDAYLHARGAERTALLAALLEARRATLADAIRVFVLRRGDAEPFDDAVAAVLARDGGNLLALRLRAWAATEDGDPRGAKRIIRQAAGIAHPSRAEWWRELLRAELAEDTPDAAALAAALPLATEGATPLAALSLSLQARLAAGEPLDTAAFDGAVVRAADAAFADPLPEEIGFPEAIGAYRHVLCILRAAGTIALVGNGPSLSGSGCGAAIDAADTVVRINYPPLSGFAADVGRRTDLMLFANAKRGLLHTLIAREPGYAALPALGIRIAAGAPPLREAVPPPRPSVPRALLMPVREIGYAAPTAGFFAIVALGLLLGKRLRLFGFDFFRRDAAAHYFDHSPPIPAHETRYEKWFVTRFLPAVRPSAVAGGG